MGFVIIFTAAWLAVFIFYSMDKSLSIPEHAFAYLIILAIGINISWVISEELKLVELTRQGLPYAGFLIYRSIVVPMIYVIMLDFAYKAKTDLHIMLSIGAAIGIILVMNGLLRIYGIWHYTHWNIFYDFLEILLMQAIGFGLLKLYRRAIHREVNPS